MIKDDMDLRLELLEFIGKACSSSTGPGYSIGPDLSARAQWHLVEVFVRRPREQLTLHQKFVSAKFLEGLRV